MNKDKSAESIVKVFNPEWFRLFVYLGLVFLNLSGIIITLLFGGDHILTHENPIYSLYGTYNLCVFFDNPPATYVLPFLWSLIVILFSIYYYLSSIQSYIQTKNAFPKKNVAFYKHRRFILLYILLSFCYFSTIFAVQPTQSMFMHSLPFAFLIVSLVVMGFENALYYRLLFKLSERESLYITLYLLLFRALSIGEMIIVANGLSEHALFDVFAPLAHIAIPIIDQSWTVTAVFLPILHSVYLILKGRDKKVSVQITFELSKTFIKV